MVDRPDRRYADNEGLDRPHPGSERSADRRVTPNRRLVLQGGAAGSVLTVFYPRTGLGAEPSVHASAACSFVGADRPCTLGLSPVFWRRNTGLWASAFGTGQEFDAVFQLTNGRKVFDNATLEDVITLAVDPVDSFLDFLSEDLGNGNAESAGAQVRVLGFQAVAALQNAATAVPYALLPSGTSPSGEQGVIPQVNLALQGGVIGDIKDLKDKFDRLNNASSPDEEDRLKQLLGG